MTVVVRLLFLIFSFLLHCDTVRTCGSLEFGTSLNCTSCNEWKLFNIVSELKEQCQECCQGDEDREEAFKFPFAELHVCHCDLRKYPQVGAFVLSDRTTPFPGLKVQFRRGVVPIINLLNQNRTVVTTLKIEKFDTDSIEDSLHELLI